MADVEAVPGQITQSSLKRVSGICPVNISANAPLKIVVAEIRSLVDALVELSVEIKIAIFPVVNLVRSIE